MSKKNSDKSSDSENMNLAELLNLIGNYYRLKTILAEKRLEEFNKWDTPYECDACSDLFLPLEDEKVCDSEDEELEFPDGFEEEWS